MIIAFQCFGQERMVTGRLTADDNVSPLPGVNVVIKGTNRGTITNANGEYAISAPIGSILVYSFIGMQTREAVVTLNGLSSVKTRIPSRAATRGFDNSRKIFPQSWSGGLPADTTGRSKPGAGIFGTNSGRLLNTQQLNAEDVFKVRKVGNNLIFQSRNQNYVPQNTSVQMTTTVGVEKANRWPSLQSTNGDDPLDFFRNILAVSTQLSASARLRDRTVLSASYERRDRTGIIPNSTMAVDNATLAIKDHPLFRQLRVSASSTLQQTAGTLLPHGANLSNIIYNAYRTPPPIDDQNPHTLAENLPDRDKNLRSVSMLTLDYAITNRLNLNVNSDYDYQTSDIVNGLDRFTQRNATQRFVNAITSLNYNNYSSDNQWTYKGTLAWHANYQKNEIDRTDEIGGLTELYSNRASRTSNEVLLRANVTYRDQVKFKLINRAYFSNTASKGSFVNFLPYISAEYNFARHIYWFQNLAPYVAFSRNIKEAPVLWTDWSYASTRMSMQSAMGFYERPELFINNNLSPEIESKFETGLNLQTGTFSFDFDYYNNTTSNLVAPIWQDNTFSLANSAVINNYGVTLSASHDFFGWSWNDTRLGVSLNWSKYNSVVRELNVSEDFIALAGFGEVATVLAKGQPVGAIYNTSDSMMIGSPIPQWIGGTSINFRWKWFKLWTNFEYRYGGEKWNGTNWALDGYAGDAEQYIEDASVVRLSELGLSYSTRFDGTPFVKSMRLALVAKNVFLITKYSGVDPSSPLFGYQNGSALDLFNVPATKGVHANITMKF